MRKIRTSGVKPFILSNKSLVSLMALMLFGTLVGSLLAKGRHDAVPELSVLTQGFISIRSKGSILSTFTGSLTSSGVMVLLAFLLGYSAISAPLLICIPFFRGLGLGVSMGYIYMSYGLNGILICILLLLPSAVLSSVAIIIASREGIRFSKILYLTIHNPENHVDLKTVSKNYISKFTVIFGIIIFSALAESILTFIFVGLIQFPF